MYGQTFSGQGNGGDLEEQIEKMQAHTGESYVWFYAESGVRSIKSTTLRGASIEKAPTIWYLAKCATFFGEFVQCKHGDTRIGWIRPRNSITT